MKKIISIVLFIVMLISFSATAFSAVPEGNLVAPCYVTIDGIVCTASEEDGDIYAGVSVRTTKTCSVEITMVVQRSTYGTSWTNHKSFPTVTLTKGSSRSTSRTVNDVPTGYYYRTYATVKVYVNGILTDSDIVESNPVYVPAT